MSVFKKMATQRPASEEIDIRKCFANNCPCRATTQLEQGRWMCTYHAFAVPEKWPAITEKLHSCSWLIAFIGDIHTMDTKHEEWRAFALQFWSGIDDFCMPDEVESAASYAYRMRGELAHRVGVSVKRPNVRRPQPIKARGVFQNFAEGSFV